MLEILKEPKENTYVLLIKYLCQNNDVMMFVNRLDGIMRTIVAFEAICNEMNMDETQLLNEYKINGIKNIFNKTRYNQEVFKFKGLALETWSEMTENEIIKIKESFLETTFKYYLSDKEKYILQQKNINNIKKMLEPYLIKERHNPEWVYTKSDFYDIELPKYKDDYIYDICFYRITKEVEEFLLKYTDGLYKWDAPYLPSNISFFKDKCCTFTTVTYEDMSFINVNDKQEYKYLTDIGLELEDYSKNIEGSETYIEDYTL